MLDQVLKWIGAGDSVLTTMGPIATIVLALFFGCSTAQLFKFLIKRWVRDAGLYDFTVRVFAAGATVTYSHFLSDALSWPFELGLGPASIAAYHVARSFIRKYAPWLETSPLVGSANPPAAAYRAAAERAARK